jgi:uncharacterized protein YdhG (YjbR/CyaY superfamily)
MIKENVVHNGTPNKLCYHSFENFDMSSAVDPYIAKQPSPQRELLEQIRDLILKVQPEAKDLMSYGVPACRYQGKTILYAAFKNHIGIYPGPAVIEAFAKELEGYKTSKGAIQFTFSVPLPLLLIEKMIKAVFTQSPPHSHPSG